MKRAVDHHRQNRHYACLGILGLRLALDLSCVIAICCRVSSSLFYGRTGISTTMQVGRTHFISFSRPAYHDGPSAYRPPWESHSTPTRGECLDPSPRSWLAAMTTVIAHAVIALGLNAVRRRLARVGTSCWPPCWSPCARRCCGRHPTQRVAGAGLCRDCCAAGDCHRRVGTANRSWMELLSHVGTWHSSHLQRLRPFVSPVGTFGGRSGGAGFDFRPLIGGAVSSS